MAGLDVGPKLPGAFKDIVSQGIRHNEFPHIYNMPWTGNNGTSKANAFRIGRITAPQDPASNGGGAINRFFFHYNPQSVSLQTSVSPDVRTAADMAAPQTFSNILTTETLSFDFLLNRIPDVAMQDKKTNASAQAYGTLHDLYYLFGLINRNFTDAAIKNFDYPNTDVGLIEPFPVVVIFGELFRFKGYVTDVSIQHAKFVASPLSTATSAPLVPVLTNVSLGLKRLIGDDDSGGGGSDTTGGAGTTIAGTTPQWAAGMPDFGEPPNQAHTSKDIYGDPGPSVTLPGPGHGSDGSGIPSPGTDVPGG